MPERDVLAASEAVRDLARSHHLLLLLDFDGTLCEFNPDPAAVWLAPRRRELLLEISSSPDATLGIVSGRRLSDVRARAGLQPDTYCAGLHGLEIAGEGERFVHPEAARATDVMARLHESLARDLSGLPGVFIENKGLSIAAHYRRAAEADAQRVPALVLGRAGPYLDAGTLRVLNGACVMELLPNISWNKGNAVEWIRDRVAAKHEPIACVYVGDDTTDEDAFRVVRGRGLAIAASPGPSGADLVIAGPADVERLLESLVAGDGRVVIR